MRLLIVTIGSAGDIHPFIAIGIEMLSRGHQVAILANPHFKARIESAGLSFRPLGTEQDYLAVLHDPHLIHARRSPALVIRTLIADAARPTAEAVALALREFKPDLVLRHHISFAVRWVCERERVPCAVGVLSPLFWFSRADPGVYRPTLGMYDPPIWLRRRANRLGRYIARLVIDRPLNRIRREMGLPSVRDLLFEECLEGVVNLGLWSPRFRPPAPDDPPNGVICGYCTFDRNPGTEHAPTDIERFLDECERASDPPIVVTLGSSVVHHAGNLYHRAANACRRLGRRGLLLTADEDSVRDLPAGVRAFGYAPYRSVFPHAAAIVHHGGAGTTGAALRAGKPTLVIPFANDEFDNASRARRLGTSETLRPGRVSPRTLTDALQRLLAPSTLQQAAMLGHAFASENGHSQASNALEAVAHSPSSSIS